MMPRLPPDWEQRNPTSPQDLKNIMELENGHMICQQCHAVMWVEINQEGESILMRASFVPMEACAICEEIHEIAQR